MYLIARLSFIFSILLLLSTFTTQAYASPAFARQYDTKCNTCHTKTPALNNTGLGFLRKGFRFTKEEATALELMLAKDGKKRKIPVAMIVGAGYSSDKEEVSVGAKLFLTGSLTQNLSFFGVTKEGLVNSDNDNMKFFNEESSRAFFQYNLGSTENVFVGGLFAPLSQYSNIRRASAGSGLQDAKPEGLPGFLKYKTPLQRSKVERLKGLQYSYLSKNNIQLSLAYGEQVSGSARDENRFSGSGLAYGSQANGDGSGGGPGSGSGGGSGAGAGSGSGGGSGNVTPTFNEDESSYSLIASMRFDLPSQYQLGLIYNRFEEAGKDAYSVLLPLQKNFKKVNVNSTIVYKDSDAKGQYYGWENAAIYSLGMMTYIKGIANFGKDENDDNEQGYHLSINKMFNKHFMAGASAIHVDTEYQSTSSINASVHLIF
jgi:hypothetical protein